MPPAVFELTNELPQTHALDRAANGIGTSRKMLYRPQGADKSFARPTALCILFDG